MWEIFEQLRIAKGVTAYQVCKDLGFQQGMISNWKMGRYSPKVDKLQKIADYFGVSLEYLTTGKANDSGYYLNPDTAKKAQEAYEKYGILFDAAEGAKPEDIELAVEFLNRLKGTNNE